MNPTWTPSKTGGVVTVGLFAAIAAGAAALAIAMNTPTPAPPKKVRPSFGIPEKTPPRPVTLPTKGDDGGKREGTD